jgi:hypothetical protein
VIATDLVAEKLVTPKEAILLVDLSRQPATGPGLIPMSGRRSRHRVYLLAGAVSGEVVFSADRA